MEGFGRANVENVMIIEEEKGEETDDAEECSEEDVHEENLEKGGVRSRGGGGQVIVAVGEIHEFAKQYRYGGTLMIAPTIVGVPGRR
jgi:hypothetical protein